MKHSPLIKGISFEYSKDSALDPRVTGWIGNHLIRLENARKGLEYYNEALKKEPCDVNILCRRAVANIKGLRLSKGTEDVEHALRLDPNNIHALGYLMHTLYLDGEFEKSMLVGLRNIKYRKQPPHFSLGILRAESTIQNGIGDRAGHPLRDHYEIIRELAWLKNMSMQKGKPKRKMNRIFSKKAHKERASTSVNPSKTVKPFKKELNGNEGGLLGADREVKEGSQIKPNVVNTKITEAVCESSVCMIRPIFRTLSTEFDGEENLTTQSLESRLEDSNDERELLDKPKLGEFPYRPLQRRTKNIDNFISSVYLGQLFQEKKFLAALPQVPGCLGKNVVANNEIRDVSNGGLETLNVAKEILRTRRPFYHIKYQEMKTKTKKIEMDKLKLLEQRRLHSLTKIDKFFSNIAMFVQSMDLYHMSKMADLMYKYIKKTDKDIIPTRDSILCRLYKLIGEGYFLSYKFLPDMTSNQRLTRMRLAMGLPIARTNSQESLCKKILGRSFKWT